MPKDKLTPKQEAFVLEYVKTGNALEAYRRAYDAAGMSPATIDKEARRLLEHPRITPRLAALAKKEEAKALITLEEHLIELRELREMAKQIGNVNAAIRAEELRGRVCRHYIEQVETGNPGDFSQLNDAELNAEYEAVVAELELSPASTKH